MKLFIINLIIQALLIFSVAVDPELSELPGLIVIFTVGFILSLTGLLYFLSKNKTFAYLGMIGSAFFIPIGIIGILALRKNMDKEKRQQFLEGMEND